MNTKILFYCINVSRDGFEKIIFETILKDNIESLYDANDWVDDNISIHYDKFDLEFVLDWFVLLYELTDDESKDTEIIKTVNGKLIFEDEYYHHYYKLGKIVHEKNEIKKEVKKLKKELKSEKQKKAKEDNNRKDYPSMWIEPTGDVHEVSFAHHNDFAREWLEENDKETFDKVQSSYNKYHYDALQDLGWIRILGWTKFPTFVITRKVTPKQRAALKEYCLSNDVPYSEFPNILKN